MFKFAYHKALLPYIRIMTKEFSEFIERNQHEDVLNLKLKTRGKSYSFDIEQALVQIECRQKTRLKLKEFLQNPQLIFPDVLSSEQASHEAVAKYHASLARNDDKILDMTSGLGIDAMTFARNGAIVTACDIDKNRTDILNHNKTVLGLSSLSPVWGDSVDYLEKTEEKFDLIFIDPSRRDIRNRRLYNLHDCLPDIIEIQDLLAAGATRILIKASPMLDITRTLLDIKNVSSISAVGVKGECKEILIEIIPGKQMSALQSVVIRAIDLNPDGSILSEFTARSGSATEDIRYADVIDIKNGSYLLEPSAMIMKIAPWHQIAKIFSAKKLGKSSHLFITDELPSDFPGRVTEISHIVTNRNKSDLADLPATVISRNHPLSSDELRKQLRIKEGDKNFIYATRIGEKPVLIFSRAVQNL